MPPSNLLNSRGSEPSRAQPSSSSVIYLPDNAVFYPAKNVRYNTVVMYKTNKIKEYLDKILSSKISFREELVSLKSRLLPLAVSKDVIKDSLEILECHENELYVLANGMRSIVKMMRENPKDLKQYEPEFQEHFDQYQNHLAMFFKVMPLVSHLNYLLTHQDLLDASCFTEAHQLEEGSDFSGIKHLAFKVNLFHKEIASLKNPLPAVVSVQNPISILKKPMLAGEEKNDNITSSSSALFAKKSVNFLDHPIVAIENKIQLHKD